MTFHAARSESLGIFALLIGAASACGGITIIGDDGNGGAGATGSTSSGGAKTVSSSTKASTVAQTNSAVVSTVAVGPGGMFCDSHDDCGVVSRCDFSVFRCAPSCGPGAPPCPPNLVCNPCGTSSCPTCRDCLSICTESF